MSTCAIVAVEHMTAANTALEEQGFGPRNFSVPAYISGSPRYAALHAWNDAALIAALQALPNVIVQDGPLQTGVDGQGNPIFTEDPVARTKALIEAQGAKWGAQSPPLPSTGTVTAGSMYTYGNGTDYDLWYIIQTFNRTTFSQPPATYPALMRIARDPYKVGPWKQPIDQYDAYKLVNQFTNAPDQCTHNGQTWKVTQADGAGNNVWEPGVFGWTVVP